MAAGALADALAALDPGVRAALEEAIRRARLVHEAQRPADHVTAVAPGATVTERYVPVGRAGVYVPGGLVTYPSSVIMNVVPAQVAGVAQIAVASPPRAGHGGLPAPAVLAACALLGIEEVHAAGGAQAIAMFAYGTADCAPADIVTGPGNVYVAAAKRLLRGTVGTDAEAGPTEVAIIADHTATPRVRRRRPDRPGGARPAGRVPADHHRPRPRRPGRAARWPRSWPPPATATGYGQALAGQSACVLVDDADAALAVSDAWAPEHLEIQAEDAAALAARVRNAGAVFVGPYAPVSLGDYLAGSNHVLPTGGTARHTGGLSVLSFLRGIHVVECSAARWPGPRRTSTRSAGPRTCPPTSPPSGSGCPARGGQGMSLSRMAAAAARPGRPGRLRGTPARRAGPAEHQREPLPAIAGAGQGDRRRGRGGRRHASTATPTGTRSRCARTSPPTSGTGSAGARCGRPTAPTRSSSSCCRPSAAPAATAIGFEPSYSMHPLIARATATAWLSGARDGDFGLDPARAVRAVRDHRPDVVFLTSPNNPTGGALPLAVIEAVCDAAPGMVVVDEAYAEFARDGSPAALALLPRYPRLVVTRTMSKAFALAGARVGYLAADPAVIEALLLVRLPYHLSAVTQAVARAALAHAAELLATVQALRAERDRLVGWLREPGACGGRLGRELRPVRRVR